MLLFAKIINVAVKFSIFRSGQATKIKENTKSMRIKKQKRGNAPKAKIAPAEWQEFIEI